MIFHHKPEKPESGRTSSSPAAWEHQSSQRISGKKESQRGSVIDPEYEEVIGLLLHSGGRKGYV